MMPSPQHFEELDWLDFVQGKLADSLRARLDEHLSACGACRERVVGLRELSDALGETRILLQNDPDVRAAASTQSRPPEATDARLRGLWERAAATASELAEESDRCRRELMRHMECGRPLRTLPRLAVGHVAAANTLARERLRTDLSGSRQLIEDALGLLGGLPGQDTAERMGTEGLLRTSRAYLFFRNGAYAEALDELDLARPLLERIPLADLELAYWSYVRGSILQSLTRFAEALQEIREAERIYTDFEDWDRAARCKTVRAILLSNAGHPEDAVPLYEELLRPGGPALEDSLRAILYQDLAYDLVLTNRLSEAKAAYARAARLYRKTHQEDLLFRVRIGVAEIAYKEGRLEDALALNEALRPQLRARHLRWDAIQRELRIAELQIKLGRTREARGTCEAILPEAGEVGLADEVLQTLETLDSTDEQASLSKLASMQEYLRRAQRAVRASTGAA